MSDLFNSNRAGSSKVTPINRSKKSSCAAVFYRYKDPNITKLLNLNATNDQQLANLASSNSSGNLNSRDRLVIRQDIISCSISNNKGSSSGTFSLTLKRGKKVISGVNTEENINYLEAIHPGDWITIYMKRSGKILDADISSTSPESGFKFLGIVENVRYMEVDDPNRGTPRLEFVVTGKSFGKVFETSIFFNPIVNQKTIETVLGLTYLKDSGLSIKPLSTNTADNVVRNLVNFYLGRKGVATASSANESWYIPQPLANLFRGSKLKKAGKSVVDILDTSRIGLHKYAKNTFNSAVRMNIGVALIKALPASGTIWSILQFMQNSAVNEMYTELVAEIDAKGNKTGRLRPALVMRQVPFSNRDKHETNVLQAHRKSTKKTIQDSVKDSDKTFFVDLPYTSILSSDIKQKNVGKNDHERINYVIVTPKIDANTYDIAFVVASNVPSIQRYGLKMFQAQTSYVIAAGTVNQNGIKTSCQKCVDLMKDWFFLGHNLFNGTIVTDGVDGFVELGTNLYISDAKQLFHIEGYTHNFDISPDGQVVYTSTFKVSRGQLYDFTSKQAKFIGVSETTSDPTTVVTSYLRREGDK